jgi:hypothetical protein
MPNYGTRRATLRGIVGIAVSVAAMPNWAQGAPESVDYADTRAADVWMRTWIDNVTLPDGTKAPRNTLHLTRFADPVYVVTKEMGWDPNPDQQGYMPVRVPVGFVTDFASIPRPFWSMLKPDGLYSYAAIVHDYLYWQQTVQRATADEIFKFAMQDFKISSAIVDTIYLAVRGFGGSDWDQNLKLKESGERRVLLR